MRMKEDSMIKKIVYYLKHPNEALLRIVNLKIFRKLNDKTYLKIRYRIITGKKLNLDNPVTFNEKLQWLKLHDRNPKYTKLVDKIAVREYIKEIIGEEYLIPIIGVYNTFDEIDFSKLPNQFVMKCNHDSGGLVICKDKKQLDYERAKTKINESLDRNYYYWGREWPYKNIKPKILIEEYMEDKKEKELIDYKIMCFNGKPQLSFTCSERYKEGLKVTFFDLDWNKLPFERHYPASKRKIKKPQNYEKMLELSEKLSKDIPFVRVDWYEINGHLYFGELTFYPGNGVEEFNPEEWDKKLGDLVHLPKVDGDQ